ncbi:hypothetical protein DLAC_06497 [Tieghemostelium lacteum]|uniref:Transmembrane protein n=1 Tax=Tieghemostelium lacteum TaxID=361077 RepID=A0A151ZF13_TIELA|nr:hypothetical protein DLAC_06497 [Tieghemostelium lacteum]|eukprot:KYQ92507.1 hypothetical protein DLAC_06497 [Tieghemostelium lacteum]
MLLFLLSKIISFILFIVEPSIDNAQSHTLYYLFDVWSVFFILLVWSFISSYWIQVLYTYFVPHDFNLNKVYRALAVSYGAAIIYLCYQVSQSVLAMKRMKSWENYGFIGFVVFVGLFDLINGFLFLGIIKKSQDKSQHKNLQITETKTKVLVADLIISISLVIVQFAIFTGKTQVGLFLGNLAFAFLIEINSITMIMFVLGNLSLKPYFFFKRIKSDLAKSSSQESSKLSNQMNSIIPSEKNSDRNDLESSGVISIKVDENQSN